MSAIDPRVTFTAASRTPVEVWHRILDAILYEPVLFDYTSPWHVFAALRDHHGGTGHTLKALECQRLTLTLVCRPWHAYLSETQRCIALEGSKGRARGRSFRPEVTLVLGVDSEARPEDLLEALSIHTSLRSLQWIKKDPERRWPRRLEM